MTPIRIGFDIAKNVFQVHGVDDKGTVVIRKRLRRPAASRANYDRVIAALNGATWGSAPIVFT